jgi:hypothetical protein
MTDKMEPVAYTDEVELEAVKDGNGLMWPSPLPNPDGETGLYTADQVKELTDGLKTRIINAEAALAEARKVIEPFAAVAGKDIGESEHDEDYFEPMKSKYGRAPRLRVKHMRALSRWLQANKGDA